MSLIDAMMEDFCLMEKIREPDGAGGMLPSTWKDGSRFRAAITRDTTMQARKAEQEGVSSVYTVTTKRNMVLDYHDVIKRLSDGRIFRITSDGMDKMSPSVSTLDIAQVTAEKWELTT